MIAKRVASWKPERVKARRVMLLGLSIRSDTFNALLVCYAELQGPRAYVSTNQILDFGNSVE